MDLDAVTRTYRRWAPVYDRTFGIVTRMGRQRAVAEINRGQGRVLEVGVGTGLSLPGYAPHLEVTGIDYSDDMLAIARDRVTREGLTQVRELRQMDARRLDFPDAHFDWVVAMYLVSVVPDPETVIAEISRVCKPGGQVIIVNHFARETGPLAWIERRLAPLANRLGWHADFEQGRILGEASLQVAEERRLSPAGLFTFLRLQKRSKSETETA